MEATNDVKKEFRLSSHKLPKKLSSISSQSNKAKYNPKRIEVLIKSYDKSITAKQNIYTKSPSGKIIPLTIDSSSQNLISA